MNTLWDAYLNNLDEKGKVRTRTDDSYRNLTRGLRELRVEYEKRFGKPYSLENIATEINTDLRCCIVLRTGIMGILIS